MALVKGTNSYGTVREADSYFASRLDSSAWDTATEPRKEQALINATTLIDQLEWEGIVRNSAQSLAFPRYGSYYDPWCGYHIDLPPDVPLRIKNATFELAYHLLANEDLMTDAGVVKDFEIGPIKFNGVRGASLIPHSVKKIVKPILRGGGAHLWWRAN